MMQYLVTEMWLPDMVIHRVGNSLPRRWPSRCSLLHLSRICLIHKDYTCGCQGKLLRRRTTTSHIFQKTTRPLLIRQALQRFLLSRQDFITSPYSSVTAFTTIFATRTLVSTRIQLRCLLYVTQVEFLTTL